MPSTHARRIFSRDRCSPTHKLPMVPIEHDTGIVSSAMPGAGRAVIGPGPVGGRIGLTETAESGMINGPKTGSQGREPLALAACTAHRPRGAAEGDGVRCPSDRRKKEIRRT